MDPQIIVLSLNLFKIEEADSYIISIFILKEVNPSTRCCVGISLAIFLKPSTPTLEAK